MRTYETTFIINPQADDATLDKQVTSITDLIKQNGGNILCENRIGTRRMAYEIAGLGQGYYTQLFYEAPQDALPVLDRFFKLEEQYIRFMTVLFEGPVPTLEDLNRSAHDDDRDDRSDRNDRNKRHNDDEEDEDDDRRDHRRHSGRREERPRERVERVSETPVAKEEAPQATAAPVKVKPAEVKPAEEKPATQDDDIL